MTTPDIRPRDVWLDAVLASDLPAPHRSVAIVYARHAGDGDTTWVTEDRLVTQTGWSRRTVYAALHGRPSKPGTPGRRAERAIPGLIARGWLVPVHKRRQYYSPRYRMVIPEVSERRSEVSERRSEVSERHVSEVSERPPEVSERPPEVSERPPEVSERHPSSTRDLPETHHHQEGAGVTAQARDAAVVAARALVVVVGSNGIKPDQKVLARACLVPIGRGWSPGQIESAARDRGWQGAGPGAVVTWVRGLDEPPAPKLERAPGCGHPECVDGIRGYDSEDRPIRCPVCKPHVSARNGAPR